jgi:predicted ATPase/DNA-binding winged helix-turn-helix (wHTH) protein
MDRGKRAETEPGEAAAFGPFRLVPAARLLERDGKPVEIGGRALEILIELVKQAGRVVSAAELMSAIWADTTVVDGVLRTHVYNLRKALGDGSAGARYVTHVAGRGYCFVAPVVRSVATDVASAGGNVWKAPLALPLRLARMAGRDDALRKLAAQLAEHRFVTVLGPAGIGKTTVAVAAGHALLDEFEGAVHFIELGSLTDPTLVASTVASTLGVPTQSDDALEGLQAFLQDKRVLLVLDNCEHVVAAAAHLAEQLFLHVPRVHLLTTSREALRAEGEYAHRLGPLETPEEVLGMDAKAVQRFAAVQVFLERAAASGWSDELTDGDVPIVAETCRRLDGVPLAIELAASFVGRCGLQGIVALLDDGLGLLWQHGRRTAPPRQQTLHALISWSYDRLPEQERAALRRLSVFVGAFSFDAAKAIVLDGGDSAESLLEALNELTAKSLLATFVDGDAVAYRLLETTRTYALERLAEAGELATTSIRHARLFAERLERPSDLGNVRAALRWSFSSPSEYAVGVRLVAAAARMLLELGLVSECQNWCRRAIDVIAAPDAATLVEVGLHEAFAISAMFSRGNGEDVRGALNRAVELSQALAAVDHEVRLLGHLNSFLVRRGEFKEALEVAERSSCPSRAATVAGQIRSQWMLAFSHHLCGNQATAERHCEEALRLEAASDESPAALTRRSQGLFNHSHQAVLARTLWLRGKADRALAIARSIVDRVRALKHPFERSSALLTCEAIFVWCGELAEAEGLLDKLSELVERYSLGSQRGAAMAMRGELLVRTGRPEEGCALLKRAATLQKAEQNASFVSVYAGALAEGLAATGSLEEALRTVEGAIADAEVRGAAFNLPELRRVQGLLLVSRAPTDRRAGEEALSTAIELARHHGALAWELRATTSLARERLRRGGSRTALRELAAVYASFTEGKETPDLRTAHDVLEGLVDP